MTQESIDIPRPFKLANFAVHAGVLIAIDEGLPVAAEMDIATGAVTKIHDWELSKTHRGRPVALDVIVHGDSIFVASPAAGGIVRIDRTSGRSTVIPLDEDPGFLLASETHLWAVAASDWMSNSPVSDPDQDLGTRPVIWELAPPPRPNKSGWTVVVPKFHQDDGDPAPEKTLEEWRTEEGDTEPLEPPTPIWTIVNDVAVRVPFDGEAPIFAAIGDRLVGVSQLPTDPIVKSVDGDMVSWGYPGSVVVLQSGGDTRTVGNVRFSSGSAWIDGDRIWLVGFGPDLDGESPEVREVLTESLVLGDPVPVELEDPSAIINGRIVDIKWGRPPSIRLLSLEDELELANIEAPELDRWQVTKGDGTSLYVGSRDTALVMAVSLEHGTISTLKVDIDLREFVPSPQPQENVDLAAHEDEWLSYLRRGLFGGWHNDRGVRPLIHGVTIDSVELTGTFPDSSVVGLFHEDDRPDIEFGRQWRLYDELGNINDLTYAEIYLMEDIEAHGRGLPPSSACAPDDDGVVWF